MSRVHVLRSICRLCRDGHIKNTLQLHLCIRDLIDISHDDKLIDEYVKSYYPEWRFDQVSMVLIVFIVCCYLLR